MPNKETILQKDENSAAYEHEENETEGNDEKMLTAFQMERQIMHSGPIPHPELLKQYDDVVPGAAERILSMAEKQSEHRIAMEKKVINTNARDSLLGIISGFILSLLGIAGGIYSAIKGSQIAGTVIAALSIGSLVSTFIYGTRSERIERIGKDKDK